MGVCYSSSTNNLQQPLAANIVSASGSLHRFQTPITVSDALLRLTQISSSSPSLSKNYFISNSDRLSYGELVPAMSSDEELVANQIYFVFPNTKLRNRLSASDMADLAVKASLALDKNSKLKAKPTLNKRRVQNKISPYIVSDQSDIDNTDYYYNNNATVKSGGLSIASKPITGLTTSSSLRKIRRNSSKRAKMAARSFRLNLSTIQEASQA